MESEGDEQHSDSGDSPSSLSCGPPPVRNGKIPCLLVVIYLFNACQMQENKLEEIKLREKRDHVLQPKEKNRSTAVCGWKGPFMSWEKCKEGRAHSCIQYFI